MEHTKRTSRHPAFWLTAALVFGLLVSLLAAPAHAAESYEAAAGVWQSRSGENRTTYAAVVVELGDDIYLFAPDMSEYDTVYGAITVDDSWKPISYYGREENEMSMWVFDEDPDVAPLHFGSPIQNEECWLVYSATTVETGTMRVTVTAVVDEEERLIAVSGMPDSDAINYPAAVVNSANEVVGVATSPDYIWAPGFSSDTFYGGSTGTGDSDSSSPAQPAPSRSSSSSSGGGSATPLLVVAGVIAVAVVLLVLSKKKKNPAAGSAQPLVNQPERAGAPDQEYTQPPMPAVNVEDIGKTQPVNTDEQARVTGQAEQVETAAGQLWLVVTGGYMLGRVYPIDQDELVIGRSPTASIPYQDETVSKVHCKLYRENGMLMLMDCNSANGTYLQRVGKLAPMQPVALQPGDVFCIGSTKNEFQIRT